MRLLYLRQDKHQLHYHSSAAWGASAIYEGLRETVWLAKHTALPVFSQTPDSANGTLGHAWIGLGEAVDVPPVPVILREMLGR